MIKITCSYCDKKDSFYDEHDAHKTWRILGTSVNNNCFVWVCDKCEVARQIRIAELKKVKHSSGE